MSAEENCFSISTGDSFRSLDARSSSASNDYGHADGACYCTSLPHTPFAQRETFPGKVPFNGSSAKRSRINEIEKGLFIICSIWELQGKPLTEVFMQMKSFTFAIINYFTNYV